MIHGHKPNGEWQASPDEDSLPIARETRQCVHCQYMWTYNPGSGTLRGFCLKHNGWLCARPECLAEQDRMILHFSLARGWKPTCLAFEEYQEFLVESIQNAGDQWELNSSGILIPKTWQ